MLRYRELYQKGTEVILKVVFDPSEDEPHIASSGVEIRWNPKRLAMLRIERLELDHQNDLPFSETPLFYSLPELEQIQEEVNYLFNLILSLKPYEIKTQTEPENFPSLPY